MDKITMFRRFMKYHKAWDIWTDRLMKERKITVYDYLKDAEPTNFICSAFLWDYNGVIDWNDLNRIWKKCCRYPNKYKIFQSLNINIRIL